MKILKCGTLRFWGDWFGRPMDNYHKVIMSDYREEDNVLILDFDNDEKCTIYNPENIVNEKNEFHIEKASEITWEWYCYGKAHTAQNLCKRIYTLQSEDTVSVEYLTDSENSKRSFNAGKFYAIELC